ncbi:uncharacterized protein B0H18DRAFT_1049205 [Fomitopsis serialis]|uniref:uncharacterized protein n=1 Tax=Fomitopsis serialis TaxID=139415 RepID=UPI002008959B|nr:uncharacterized protein B0H18DRAFT_1049205 [Neoantrodia serialis]KAH9913367.1 hypothetical protein B0H18DRAFT_1049205 [Neoantrodia serialis]
MYKNRRTQFFPAMADEVHVSNPRHDASKTGELDPPDGAQSSGEPSKWESFKDKVGDTISSMKQNARDERELDSHTAERNSDGTNFLTSSADL